MEEITTLGNCITVIHLPSPICGWEAQSAFTQILMPNFYLKIDGFSKHGSVFESSCLGYERASLFAIKLST